MSHPKLFRPHAEPAGTASRAASSAPRQGPALTPGLTLAELDAHAATFLDHARYVLDHSPVTVRTYRAVYANFRAFLCDPAATEQRLDVRLRDLEAWAAWNRRRGVSSITVNTYWRSLKPFFAYLERTIGLPSAFRGSRAPAVPRDRIPKALRPEQLVRILDAARNFPWRHAFDRERATALMAILVYGGLRKSEALHLKYGDVDLAAGKIDIVRGKGRHGGKDRTVYMPRELRVQLGRYVSARRAAGITCPEFFASRGNRHLSETQFRRILRTIRTAAGVPFFAHALRHSYITLLLRSRVPLHIVQSLAGHADMETTSRYVAAFDEDKRAAVQRIRLPRAG